MKKMMLSAFVLACSIPVFAQQPNVFDFQKHPPQKKGNLPIFLSPSLPKQGTLVPGSTGMSGDKLFLLANGDKLIYGRGSMPCITTDMQQFTVMPNVAAIGALTEPIVNNNTPGKIPNGAQQPSNQGLVIR